MSNYYNICYHDNSFTAIKNAGINITSLTLRYAISVFEGIRLYKQKDSSVRPFKLDEHLSRLNHSARSLHIPTKDETGIAFLLKRLIHDNKVEEDAYVRICYTLPDPGTIGVFPEKACLSITISKMGRKKWLQNNLSIRLKLADLLRPPKEVFPCHIKSISNYAAARIELKNLNSQGFDMLLYTNREGLITEAPTSIIMFAKKDTLITPPLSVNILPSITRSTILDLCDRLNIKTEERNVHISELPFFDEAFLCGTGIEIAPVKSINDIEYLNKGKVTGQIIEYFFKIVRNIK